MIDTGDIYAGLELGTSTARLVIGHVSHDGVVDVRFEDSYVHGLAGDLVHGNSFDEQNIDDLAHWMAHAQRTMITYGVKRAHIAATSVIGHADEAGVLLEALRAESGLNIHQLGHMEEVEVALKGNRKLIDPDADLTVFVESGAGSNEFALLSKGGQVKEMRGFKFGAATYADIFEQDFIEPSEIEKLEQEIRSTLEEELAEWKDQFTKKTSLLIAGAPMFVVRYLTKTELEQMVSLEGRWTTKTDLENVFERYLDLGPDRRRDNNYIYGKSAHLVTPATLIMKVIMDIVGVEGFTIGAGGLGRGLLLSAAAGEGMGLAA